MYEYKITIDRVVDGDTIEATIDLGFNSFLKESIRLSGVNTPEVFGAKASPEGKVASEYTKNWISVRQAEIGYFRYLSEKYNSREKYGRCLGKIEFIHSSGKIDCLNDDLILKGWAY